ncbi:NAD(P)-binding protein [Metschnikowia bicuspidata var. bicuspidata NRRL YB-4993]|uniref:NAD(P)-binding protein n=1 Tax=Metschnikowia bicuspidata var. bicuspidata NRRL YB-4993 TaxID=869754 RepID=A0A1A0HI68_9ASCO|nr:NAD(P)-binding protein [Metschnikowia bicuspidata var. bicuspidata NRRL YB-4993]OBA23700.1 NAD(P)-binding protein [Metschnikowia bicuspidata var. bicuspidata NRRL YB-4993]
MSFDPGSLPYVNPKKDRRIALITAGNSGIGYFTVLHLYLHGYVVYIAGRSKTRCKKSMDNLTKEARYAAARYSRAERPHRFFGELHFLEMDLSSLSSVLGAVAYFKSSEKSLNLLINNAGNSFLPYTVTPDGFELQLQTNYVAPFLLTTKLLPTMERTVDLCPDAGPPRIVYITSVTHRFVLRYFNLSTRFHYKPNALFTWIRYAIAKTAGIHFMKMLALRNPRLICTSVQPGIVMSTDYFAYWTRLPIIGSLFWCLFQIFSFIFGASIEKGAQAVFNCCVDPTLTPKANSGSHFDLFHETQPAKVANNMDYAAQSWIWTIHQLEKRNIDFA